MRLYIVRHAETDNNKKKIVQGRINTSLSKKGRGQAEKLSKKLLKYDIDVIYCSDLRRCKQTIAPYLNQSKIPIYYKKEIRERNHGIFEGKPIGQFVKWFNENGYERRFDIAVPKGESFKDVKKRAKSFLDKLIVKEKRKNVLIVTHGGIKTGLILTLFKKDEKKHYKKYRSENTALTIVDIKEDGNHKARLLNSIRHLE